MNATLHGDRLFVVRQHELQVYESGGERVWVYADRFTFPEPVRDLKSARDLLFVLAGRTAYLISGGPDVANMYVSVIQNDVDCFQHTITEGLR